MKITTSIQMPRGFTLAVAADATMLAGCATGPNASPTGLIEPFSRKVFRIDEDLDKGVLKPVAQTYVNAVPSPTRTTVSNFFSNADGVYSAVNNLLQLKGTAALEDTIRMAINAMLGLDDLIDIASDAGLPKHKEGFGRTLGVWGVPSGLYVVQSLLGLSTACGTMGFLIDWQMDPLTYWHSSAIICSLTTLHVVDVCANLPGAGNVFKQTAVDKYTFLRNAYLQRRRYLIYDGNLPEDQDNTKPPSTGDATVSPCHRFTPNWPVFRR